MMIIYTIGFTKKTAKQFFSMISANAIKILLDIRLNNVSQLAGFSKGNDLKYFLSEICGCDYSHCLEFAPTREIMENYKSKKISWNEYEKQYTTLIKNRGSVKGFFEKYKYENVCLLCSEPTAENCHRRLLAEMISEEHPQVMIKHL
jgi:uncharacterized protein (DUF488 family)